MESLTRRCLLDVEQFAVEVYEFWEGLFDCLHDVVEQARPLVRTLRVQQGVQALQLEAVCRAALARV